MLALPPAYAPRSANEIRLRTLVGAAECLLRGITTVQDMVRLHPFSTEHFDIVLDAYEEIGLRAVVAPHFNDLPSSNSAAFWDEEVPQDQEWRLSGGTSAFPKGADVGLIRETVVPRLNGRGSCAWDWAPRHPSAARARCSKRQRH